MNVYILKILTKSTILLNFTTIYFCRARHF